MQKLIHIANELDRLEKQARGYKPDVKTFLRYKGEICPFCGSRDINPQGATSKKGAAWQVTDCTNCGAEWVEKYDLSDVTDVIKGPDPAAMAFLD